MKVILLGTGAAVPDELRRAPSQVIEVNGQHLLFDCGGGTGHSLAKIKISPAEINHFFLTHHHIDHCVEFPSLVLASYLKGRTDKINLYGPIGTTKFNSILFDDLFTYVKGLVASKGANLTIDVVETENGIVMEGDGFSVTCAPVVHGKIPTLAYRIESEGRSVVISGDTAPCDSLIELAHGADVLIHECAFPDEKGEHPAHTIPYQLGDIAAKAKVKKVALTHLFPICNGKEEGMVESVKKSFTGDVVSGEDFMEINI